jgi:hypothetical protein
MKTEYSKSWHKCDNCGKFIAYENFKEGKAKRTLIEPDNEFGPETWENICEVCLLREAGLL